MLLVFTVFTLIKGDIFEPNQDGANQPQAQAHLQPGLVPRALLVSLPPSGGYNTAGVRVPTPPDNVPDVVSYLTN